MHHLTEFSLRRPWLTLSILLAITAVLGMGVPKVKQAYGFRVMIGEDHPAIRALDSLVEEFAGGYPVRIAWECGDDQPCETVFDPVSLRMADALTRQLSGVAVVASVLSPTNAALFLPSENGFAVRRLIENGEFSRDSTQLEERALKDPFWVGDLVSDSARVGVIVVQAANSRPDTDVALINTIDRILEPFRSQGFSFHVAGSAYWNVSPGRALTKSMDALTPAMALVIALILYLLTRSWLHTLITLAAMGLALLWTLGLLGWLSWPQDSILQVLAPVVVIVGVCDAVHLLSHYTANRSRRSPLSAHAALIAASRTAGPACLLTTLTTAGAFASFVASDLDTFIRFGAILPFGVVTCLALSFSLLPIALHWRPSQTPRSLRASATWQSLMTAILATGARRAAPILTASALLLFFFGFGWIVHLRADNDFTEAFGDSSSVVQHLTFFEDALGNSQTLELDIRLPLGTNIESPATLAVLSRLSDHLARIDALGESESVLNLVERLNRLLHRDAPEYERFANSTAANAEILELISFDDPDALSRWLSLDHTRLRISLSSNMDSRHEREDVLSQVHHTIQQIVPEGWQVQLTGEFPIQRDWVRDVQATQLRSFPIAFTIVFVLVSVFLRSWRLGLAAMVPTLLPVVVVLGSMGWLGMSLDVARAMIAAVVIGIGVDDAIHLLAHYKLRRDQGDDTHAAMTAALQHTGRAIVTTSVALALGFLTLMMSAWQTVASFGFFVALAILGALVASLFVLPALIFAFSPRSGKDA